MQAPVLSGLTFVPVDYSLDSLRTAFDGVDAVVHLAGRRMTREDDFLDIAPFIAPNVHMVRDVVRAAEAANVRRIVLASTIGVYSQSNQCPYSENQATKPAKRIRPVQVVCREVSRAVDS